jgi:hypothetical protein
MQLEQEIEGLVTRLVSTLERDAYRRTLREAFRPFADLAERAPEEVPRVLRWALDALSPPASYALLDLVDLTLDFTLDMWLPRAGTVTDAMTATLLGMVIRADGRDVEGIMERFDATRLARPLRYGFGIPKGVHIAVEGVFLNPLIFEPMNLVHFLRHRKYVAEAIPEVPFVGSILPWDGWTQLEVSYREAEKKRRERGLEDREKHNAALGCVVVTLFGPMDVLQDLSVQIGTDRELTELQERLSDCLGLTSEDYLVLDPYLERPSELPIATQNLVEEVQEMLRKVREGESRK